MKMKDESSWMKDEKNEKRRVGARVTSAGGANPNPTPH
jgi:hypothetical protein